MTQRSEIWQCPSCSRRLDVSALGFYAELTCDKCGHVDYVHTLLANFRLEGVMGIGGMSIVLRGRDVVLGRPVAIKLLNEACRNQPERIARFENECSLMAKVRHENVVSVYSAGWAKDQFYIAMELLEGRNLEAIVAEGGPLKPLRAVEVTTQIVKGLEAAHIAGMLHRDMKPGNVIVTEAGVPKVLDFGLAQGRTGEEESEEVIWATPYYVAPETLQRNAEDARTDIYSLGMTLRYLLTGRDTLQGNPSSLSSLLDAKYRLPSFAREMPGADEALCDLVDHMTAFEPKDRHDNYADLLAELQEVYDSLNRNHLAAVSPKMKLRRIIRRAVVCSSILLAAVSAYFISYWVAVPAPVREALLVSDADTVSESVKTCATEKLLSALSKAKWDQSLKIAREFEKPQQEPTLSAWCLLHGACVAYLHRQGSESVESFLSSFENALARPHPNPAASEMRAQLQSALKALENPESIKEISDRRVLGMVYCLQVRMFLADNKPDAAKSAIAAAKQEFKLAKTEPYSTTFIELTDNLEVCYAPAFAMASYHNATSYMAKHRFDDALRRFSEQLTTSPANAEEIKVLKELCVCGATLKNTLERLMGEDYTPGLTATAFRNLNREKKIVESIREQEFCALLYLLQRDYKSAFALDPYALKTDSNEPFAVLMRDWKKRLAPYMNE